MPKYFLHLVDGTDILLDPEGKELANLEAAKDYALLNAFSLMTEDVAKGKLNLSYRIDIEDGDRNVLHTVHFRDLIEVVGLQPS